MTENILDRIGLYMRFRGINVLTLEKKCGFSNGSIGSQLKLRKKEKEGTLTEKRKNPISIGVDRLEKILQIYPEINPYWIVTGKGNMIKTEKEYQFESEERMAGEPYDSEKKYLRELVRSKDDFIEKLQKERANSQEKK